MRGQLWLLKPDMRRHAEILLRTLADLVHLRVARLVFFLGRTGRANNGGVHDGACIDLEHRTYTGAQLQ